MGSFKFLENQLNELINADLLRQPITIDSPQQTVVTVDGSQKVLFCSNNYLNLASDRRIIDSVTATVEKYGFGSAASRLITGTMAPHKLLEEKFASFFNKQSALFFPSGWTANEAVLTTIPQANDIIILDKLDHASIIDAAKASQAAFRTFRGDDLSKLERLLASPEHDRKFIVTESVFSMDGNCANLKKLVQLKNKYNAILIVDEAHAVGCMGDTGAGLSQALGLLDQIDIIIAPLGKAFAANGAVVASEKTVTDYLLNKARPFIYTTSPSPATCSAAIAALDIIQNEPERRQKLQNNTSYLHDKFNKIGLKTLNSTTHIIPVVIGDAKIAVDISKQLFERGLIVLAIRPPTVAKGTSRLRISVQSDHTMPQLDALVKALEDTCKTAMV